MIKKKIVHNMICACQESQFILSKIRGVCFMTRIGFKTFVYSFVITLSVVIGVDRAFFYTPQTPKNDVQIPRKNISLFFRSPQLYAHALKSEPVYQETLESPPIQAEKVKVAYNMPLKLQKEEEKDEATAEEIPLFVEKIPDADKQEELNNIPDMPLVYSGDFDSEKPTVEESQIALSGDKSESPAKEEESAAKIENHKPIVLSEQSGPIMIKATKQIFKIDNLKKYKEKKAAENQNTVDEQVKEVLQEEEKSIPLQGNTKTAEEKKMPEPSQVASLGENVSLTASEEVVGNDRPQKRKWQTMAEKHKDDNPWLVARGSKFIKNKKILKEGFSSEAAKKKAEGLIAKNKVSLEKKTAKIAVQDNLLIPIPQDLLDEDDLVPDISDDEGQITPIPKKKTKTKTVKNTKEKSILDSLSSVFSKENREKAIKKLKAKGNNLLKSKKQTEDEEKIVILPTEIRLSFQPNRAEISGQTLRWIQAFAKKAVDDKDVGLEIRIDGSKSFALQQKRLNMLYNILTANGVDYQKINTAFVDREPNSFVVRTVKIVNAAQGPKEDEEWKKYYQKW